MPLPEEHFFTALGKRAFVEICEMEKSEQGFEFSAMGEYFSPDEMGRLVRLQQDRQMLSNNGIEVLQAAASMLAQEYQKKTERETGDLQSEIARRRAAIKKKDK